MSLTLKDKIRILFARGLVGVLMLTVVTIKGYSSRLQYEINTAEKKIQECERQIQELEVQIRSANNINNLEARALEMGLIYPDFDQIVYLQGSREASSELALALKETVFGH
mgnify:FL=1